MFPRLLSFKMSLTITTQDATLNAIIITIFIATAAAIHNFKPYRLISLIKTKKK